jgi:hypothetical protein
MQFFKDFVRNLVILVVIGVVLFFMFPDMMKQVYELYGMLFGPLAIVILIVIALPRAKRKY